MRRLLIIPLLTFVLWKCTTPSIINESNVFVDLDSSLFNRASIVSNLHKDEIAPFISSTRLHTHIVGIRAITTIECDIDNPNDRTLEALFQLKLSPRQQITGMAMLIQNQFIPASVVKKNDGQRIFETIKRKGVDPALMEQVQGDLFQLRVYPLTGKGQRSFRFTIEQDLEVRNGYLTFDFPIQSIPSKQMSLSISTEGGLPWFCPQQSGVIALGQSTTLNHWNQDVISEYSSDHLVLCSPIAPNQWVVQGEKDSLDQLSYFTAYAYVPEYFRPRPIPSSVAIIMDVSYSCAPPPGTLYGENLRPYLTTLTQSNVELISYSNRLIDRKVFQLPNELELLISSMNNQVFDGATNPASIPNDIAAAEIVLLTDGMTNFNQDEFPEFNGSLHIIEIGTVSDGHKLQYLANKYGGHFITKQHFNGSMMQLLSQQKQRIFSCSVHQTNGTSGESIATIDQGWIKIAGHVGNNAILHITYGYSYETAQTKDIPFQINKTGVHLRRQWGLKKIDSLRGRGTHHEEEITNLATQWQVVSPFTSLLVLERAEDYVEYDVEPPSMFKNAFDSLMNVKRSAEISKKDQHLKEVIAGYENRISWWEEDHKRIKKSKKNQETITATDFVMIEVNEEVSEDLIGTGAGASVGSTTHLLSSNANADKDQEDKTEHKSSIQLNAWTPDVPYLKSMRGLRGIQAYNQYLKERDEYGKSPSFYIDMADHFVELNEKEMALRILTNIIEIAPGDYRSMRILATRLSQMGFEESALFLFQKVWKIRKEEPQSYRDLGLSLDRLGKHQQAVEMLYKIVEMPMDSRFNGIDLIAVGELNEILRKNPGLQKDFIHKQLLKALDVDIRVVVTWDANDTDIDLWVTDPDGERCYYGNPNTAAGGMISDDMTSGYGPEEFMIHNAFKGKFRIELNYFGNYEQSLHGPATVQVDIYTNYGRSNQKLERITRRLSDQKETIDIGSTLWN